MIAGLIIGFMWVNLYLTLVDRWCNPIYAIAVGMIAGIMGVIGFLTSYDSFWGVVLNLVFFLITLIIFEKDKTV